MLPDEDTAASSRQVKGIASGRGFCHLHTTPRTSPSTPESTISFVLANTDR